MEINIWFFVLSIDVNQNTEYVSGHEANHTHEQSHEHEHKHEHEYEEVAAL